MKLDFNQLERLKDSFHQQFAEGGDFSSQMDDGSMVYSIHFDPHEGSCKVHVQWPYFRNLVANASDLLATYTRVQQTDADKPWLHWTCDVLGVEISTCMDNSIIVKELEALELPYEVDFSDDIENLFAMWQNHTGWNMEVNK